ncbi:MAG: DUF354 domain-containing protein, partial [Anaerohalosphaera sp.]|nr:DUF354 domain-containing protein [Anaerohalosphaera sp.]
MTKIMTGTGYLHDHGKRQRRFKGVWPQSYLAPRFFTPDPDKLRQYDIDPDQPYIILRTVAWEAAHDVGHKGVDLQTLTEVVNGLSKFGRVIICSEKPLPAELAQFQNPVPVEDVHHLLAFATLYIGEGASMAAEAAVLGTPAIYCNPLPLGYVKAMADDYQLITIADDFQHALIIADQQLTDPDFHSQYQQRSQAFIDQSDDLTDFMLETIKQVVKPDVTDK